MTPPRRPSLATVALASLAAACAEPPTIALVVSPGHEEGALTRAPAVSRLEIVASSPDGEIVLRASAAPGGSFSLGEAPADQYLDFELEGVGEDGATLVRGRSVTVPIGALEAGELPLFVQRLGETARPPGALDVAHLRAPAAIFGERYVLSTGGAAARDASGAEVDARASDFYDLLAWGGATGGLLPRSARSLVVRGTEVLVIDDAGASWVDLSSGTVSVADAPEGLDFADVAGGRTIDGLGGLSFVVGATRDEAPSSAVLVIDDVGTLGAVSLGTARRGAGATFAAGLGLVVTGGSELGAGAEVVASDGTRSEPLPFPSDPTTGAAAIATEGGLVVLVGGASATGPARTRSLDLDCLADCAAAELPSLDVPTLTARGLGFEAPTTLLVAGDSADGETLLFELEPATSTVRPLPLREPRRGATAAPAPNGTLLVIGGELLAGGGATRVESVFPR